jgi:ribosomal protein S18
MPKILKNTIKKIPSKQSLRIYKKSNSQNYYCSFYVGYSTMKSGKKEKTLRTKNVKEALKKAIETYKLIISKQDETKLVVNFEKDIASPFFKHRIQKYHLKGKCDNNNQGIREQKRFNNYMKNFFTGFDYNNHELLSQAITDLTHNLKEDKKTDNTISKYMSVLNQMFKRAKNIGVLKSLPDMPSLNVINAPRQSYFNEELNQINRRLEKLSKKKEEKENLFYLEIKDYLNLCRSGGFRPGIQPLMIKNFQYQYLTDKTNPQDPILQFTLFNTKTSPKHKLTCHPYFTKNIFPEIEKRNPSSKADDYLLFPNYKNRKTLYAKISKTFIRVSSELGLYHRNGATRPIYSIRHTFISNRYNDNAPLEVVARSANTSVKVVKKSYLDNEDTMMINEHKRLFPKVAMFSSSAKKTKK